MTVAEEAESIRQAGNTPRTGSTQRHLQIVVVAMGLAYLGVHFARKGFDLNLNIMIFIFLIFGMLLHRTPIRYVAAMAAPAPTSRASSSSTPSTPGSWAS